jgi:hypothetical protein
MVLGLVGLHTKIEDDGIQYYIWFLKKKQGITNALALPIIKMLYIYLLCSHSEHQKIRSNLNSLKTFIKETSSPNVKPILIR